MPPKRKGEETGDAPTFRDKKKVKIAEARAIQIQSTATVSSGAAGPSTGPGTVNSMQGLPTSIDVERFTEARAFEINAMQEAMENAKGASTHRAWQELPRHLRRRAASHDVRRVPVRLREKARQEMDPVKKKTSSKHISKPGKSKQISRTESFLKRQRDKSWLETHIWHAKRMHMENKWGYRLATTPTEKSYRPSHRASVHGSILNDVSYYGFIELKGAQKALAATLGAVCDPNGESPSAKRFTAGARIQETHVYKPGMYPQDLISPVIILWRPLDAPIPAKSSAGSQILSEQPALKDSKKRRKNKGKAKATDDAEPPASSADEATRTVWVRVHPAAFDDAFSALHLSASVALENIKKTLRQADPPTPAKPYEVEIADLRHNFNVFEITGPKASQVLKGALSLVHNEQSGEFRKFWSSLGQTQSAGSIPRGMVAGFKVFDPRLDFPPKNAKVDVPIAHEGLPSLSAHDIPIPSDTLAQSSIWDEDLRTQLCKPKFKKKDIDARKAKNLVPGTALQPNRKDNRVPVLLIQHSLEPADAVLSSSAPRHTSSRHGIHGWTLVLPAGWGMPFLSTLVHTGTRVGGLRERAVQAFEAGVPFFPHDYVGTATHAKEAEDIGNAEKEKWERRPPAKRVEYEKRGVESPWVPSWERVLGLEKQNDEGENRCNNGDFVSAQREDPLATTAEAEDQEMEEAEQDPQPADVKTLRPWLLRGHNIGPLVSTLFNSSEPASALHAALQQFRLKRGISPMDISAEDIWRTALVNVRLNLCGRGKPVDYALIYNLDDEEWSQWKLSLNHDEDVNMDRETPNVTQLGEVVPQNYHLIGHVTTGNFSLSLGESSAIGAVPLSKFVQLIQQTARLNDDPRYAHRPVVKVRDRDGLVCRAARLHLLQ